MPEFAPLTRRIAGSPSSEQLGRVAAFAAALGWRAVAQGNGWRLTGGDLLAAHPNDCRMAITVFPDGDGVLVSGNFRSLPWTRARMHRITGRRVEQVADWLQASFAGAAPELSKGDRRPFALAQMPAEYCRAFAGTVLMVCALMAGVMAVTTIASWFVIDGTLDYLRARVAASEAAGIPVLPPRADLEGLGFGGQLAAAALLAMPIAFFIGAMQSLALVMAELWWRASRLPLVMSCLGGVAGALAFAQSAPWFLGIPLGLVIPLAGLLAASMVWGRRGEQTALPPDPAKTRRRVGVAVFAVLAVVLLLPWPRTGKDFTDQLALFRDRYLLTHSAGIAYAHLYYRATLYSAEPTKQAFSLGEDPYDKQAPLALVLSRAPQATALLRANGFMPVSVGRAEDPAFDLVVADGPVEGAGSRLVVAPTHSDPVAWKSSLAAASRASFRGRWLLEFVQGGWQAIYYAGAIFGVALVMAPLALIAGALYGRVDSRRANLAVGATFLVTVGVLLYLYADKGPELKELAGLRRADHAALHKALESPFASVRHEAAYRLFKAKERPMLQPLIAAASDPDFRVRLWVAAALGRTGDNLATGTIVGLTSDRELLVRYRAAEGLGLLYEGRGRATDPGVVNVLLGMIREQSWYEAMYALAALRRIDPDRW